MSKTALVLLQILQLLLDLRANEMGFLGLVEKGKVKYSAFIVCTPR